VESRVDCQTLSGDATGQALQSLLQHLVEAQL
jgi:hypothetical protein